jgi:TetR/AcrR family transcriptional regulator, transcriptional repressor for nem operon
MPRYSKTHSEKTKQAIIDEASKMLREKGFTETSVANVMKAVGLTVGGFYAHFEDKNAMLKAALQEAFVETPKNFRFLSQMANEKQNISLIAQYYLSDKKVETIETGCPAAALMSEIPRQDVTVQEAFELGARQSQEALATAQGLEKNAWAAVSMLVGGLSLMRAMPQGEAREKIRTQIMQALSKLKD